MKLIPQLLLEKSALQSEKGTPHSHDLLYILLPIIAVIMYEAHILFLSNRLTGSASYLLTLSECFINAIPFLVMHYIVYCIKGRRGAMLWLLGFVMYPVLRELIFSSSYDSDGFPLFSLNHWAFPFIASLVWFFVDSLKQRQKDKRFSVMSKLFTLNAMLILLLVIWAALVAGVFVNVDDPLRNQPLPTVIDFVKINNEFSTYVGYFCQFLLIAVLIFCTYLINRYLLIQKLLAKHGVITFLLAVFITILVITPIFSSIVLMLPLNIEQFTLIPSQNYNVFGSDNYIFIFSVLAISTPIILAFERQQQGFKLAKISEEQRYTELMLLQQQIKPHFLFNTLNNLYALALKKSDDCPDMVMKLSNLLRYTVYDGQNQRVNLSKEINYLKDYIELQRIRWGKQCDLNLKWPNDCEAWLISPMLLIILLENAFKYGIEPATTRTQVTFEISIEKQILKLICINECNQTAVSEESGFGLENLSKRLKLIYPQRHQLSSQRHGDIWVAELSLELEQC
ncbi:histidine kinase [Shewanella sp. OPT22]|nr:histidine kinase [Shewanella sp. OPT22]